MEFKVAHVAEKNPDWKVVSLEMSPGSFQEEVSVNRVNKKGETFPNFDLIKTGYTVSGELWTSQAGKWYLFAPNPPKASTGGQGGNMRGVAAAQQRKGDMIEKAQENKSNAIKVASAMRDSTLLIGALGYKFETTEEMWEMHKTLRTRYIKEWDATDKSTDVPFKDTDSSTPPPRI